MDGGYWSWLLSLTVKQTVTLLVYQPPLEHSVLEEDNRLHWQAFIFAVITDLGGWIVARCLLILFSASRRFPSHCPTPLDRNVWAGRPYE